MVDIIIFCVFFRKFHFERLHNFYKLFALIDHVTGAAINFYATIIDQHAGITYANMSMRYVGF